jgi:hypothetical protein
MLGLSAFLAHCERKINKNCYCSNNGNYQSRLLIMKYFAH